MPDAMTTRRIPGIVKALNVVLLPGQCGSPRAASVSPGSADGVR